MAASREPPEPSPRLSAARLGRIVFDKGFATLLDPAGREVVTLIYGTRSAKGRARAAQLLRWEAEARGFEVDEEPRSG
jgi:hypothetical protein